MAEILKMKTLHVHVYIQLKISHHRFLLKNNVAVYEISGRPTDNAYVK